MKVADYCNSTTATFIGQVFRVMSYPGNYVLEYVQPPGKGLSVNCGSVSGSNAFCMLTPAVSLRSCQSNEKMQF